MSFNILDTDHLSLQQRGVVSLWPRLVENQPREIAITIITAEEQLRGRFLQLSQARTSAQYIDAYAKLHFALDWISRFRILDYDAQADDIFTSLRKQKIRIGTSDLRIAAIALATGSTLLTRNAIDFDQIPGLVTDNWTT